MQWWLCLLIACGGGASSAPVAKPTPTGVVGDHGVDVANLTAELPRFIDSIDAGDPVRAFAGYVVVAQHDHVIYRAAYGMADREHQRVPTADTSFRIGSVTKQFTATAILRLEQDGKLSVKDTVAKYLPEFPGPGKDVTIHQLLTHTAGIPNFTQEPANLARKGERFTPRQLLELFWDRPLDFPPGTSYAYSNSGYCVLGAIIEKVSGMTYGAYLERMLFAPAGLTRTVVGDAAGDPDRAEGYAIEDGKIVKADPIDMSFPFAAGAVRSTANDLVRWNRALAGDAVLGKEERDKLDTAQGLGDYGYAWVTAMIRGHRTRWHNGGIDGFRTIYWRVPDADLVVVAWSNVGDVDVDPIGRAAVEAALGGKPPPIPKIEPGKVDPAIVARVVGSYLLPDDQKAKLVTLKLPQTVIDTILTIEIAANPAGIELKPNGQPPVVLGATADGGFYDRDHQIRIKLALPPTGPVTAVTLEQGPISLVYRRR